FENAVKSTVEITSFALIHVEINTQHSTSIDRLSSNEGLYFISRYHRWAPFKACFRQQRRLMTSFFYRVAGGQRPLTGIDRPREGCILRQHLRYQKDFITPAFCCLADYVFGIATHFRRIDV